EAGTAQQHRAYAQCMQGLQHRCIEPVVDEHADGGAVLCQRGGVHVQRRVEIHELEILPCPLVLVGFLEKAAVVGTGTENGDLHGKACAEIRHDHSAPAH